jgi:hypothetical protein
VTRPTDDEPPYLRCPDCDAQLFPATGRGFVTEDGELIEHREACRCGTCYWTWLPDEGATCRCGAYCIINEDVDGTVYVSEVDP